VAFLGLFGPYGPLPQHFTEYARERVSSTGDRAFAAFADLFHHRMLLLFHRAWSVNHPVVCQDRPNTNRFSVYLKALCGLDADPAPEPAIPNHARLQFASRYMHSARNAEGLEALVAEYFGVRTNVHEYAAEWLEIPVAQRWKLGSSPDASSLGQSTLPGGRFFQRDQKFRLELGPLSSAQYQRYLPGSSGLEKLIALVGSYVGAELAWDLRLVLDPAQRTQLRLGRVGRLGRDAWLSLRSPPRNSDPHIIIDP
jgi:type VI secretion system protein ImpH